MSKRLYWILIGLAGLILLAFLIFQIPVVRDAVEWRLDAVEWGYDKLTTNLRNLVNPVGPVPTAIPETPAPASPTAENVNVEPTSTVIVDPTATLAPLPSQIFLPPPPFEKQTANNCGPAALSMAMHSYGWEGSQADIADQIKPVSGDRNVNPEELAYFVRNFAGWLNIDFRVDGSLPLLKRLLANHYPVIIEGASSLDPNDRLSASDDLWDAHYLLVTGYNDASQTITTQDSYYGPNQEITYSQFETDWKPFNYLYMVLYLPEEAGELMSILGTDWDVIQNRQAALSRSQSAVEAEPMDAFTWFNLGSNLVYFDKYDEAAHAYDNARELGLPLRMFRYQFGPFLAYFHSGRNEELLLLSEYALGVTEKSEETWLWYGYGLYRKGDYDGALAAWNRAEEINPKFYDDQASKAKSLLGQ
jgi:hypothetical protein